MATQHTNHPLPPPPGGAAYYPPSQQQQHYPVVQQQQYPLQQLQQRLPVQAQQIPRQYQQQPYQQHQFPSQQQQHPAQAQAPQRPPLQSRKSRPKSSFSFRSDRSQKSSGQNKLELIETHAEKEAKRLHSKADPTMAIHEAEPAAVAAGVKSSLASIRDVVAKDAMGNPIVEPDRSNPTRSRWERPLDTIRSFEAAIDGGYNHRNSMIRNDSEQSLAINRRSSYYDQPRGPQSGYYGGRPTSMMPAHSYHDSRQGIHGRDSYYDHQGPPAMGNGHRQRFPRGVSEPHFNGYNRPDQNVYPNPINQRSYETVASGSGSGTSGEQAGYQTDPTSSDNSSIDRVQSPPKRQTQPMNDYGIGFSQPSAYQQPQFSVNLNSKAPMPSPMPYNGMGMGGGAPPVPRKEPVIMRKPSTNQVEQRPGVGDKRKSWFARRFSKQG